LRLSNNSTFTPFLRMMKLCCSTDSRLFRPSRSPDPPGSPPA
jgi:hypothetical protein